MALKTIWKPLFILFSILLISKGLIAQNRLSASLSKQKSKKKQITHLKDGVKLSKKGKYDKARDEFNLATKYSALRWKGRANRATTAIHLGKPSAACKKLQKLEPSDTIMYNLGVCLGSLKRWNESILALEEASLSGSDSNFNLGSALCQIGNYDEAIPLLESSTGADARYNLGLSLSHKGNSELAYKTVFGEDLSTKALNRLAGKLCYENGDKKQAADYFKKGEVGSFESLKNAGNCFFEINEAQKAKRYYEKLVELNPTFTNNHVRLGNANVELGKCDDAVDCYKQAIKYEPSNDTAFTGMGNAYSNLGEYDESFKYYNRALKINHEAYLAWSGLGHLFFKQKLYNEALTCFQKSNDLRPSASRSYDELAAMGFVYYENGLLDEAIALFQRAISVDSALPKAYNGLGICYNQQYKFSEAVSAYDKSLAIDKKNSNALTNRGNAHYWLGNYKNAVKDYSAALLIDGENELAMNGKGNALNQMMKFNKATRQFKLSIAKHPDEGFLLNNLASVYIQKSQSPKFCKRSKRVAHLKAVADSLFSSAQQLHKMPQERVHYHNNFGVMDLAFERYEDANEEFDVTGNWATLNNKGLVALREGKPSEALSFFESSLELSPVPELQRYNIWNANTLVENGGSEMENEAYADDIWDTQFVKVYWYFFYERYAPSDQTSFSYDLTYSDPEFLGMRENYLLYDDVALLTEIEQSETKRIKLKQPKKKKSSVSCPSL